MTTTTPPPPVGLAPAAVARLLAGRMARRGPLPVKRRRAAARFRRELRAAAETEAVLLEADAARLALAARRLRAWLARGGGKGEADA